jgi:hypothetical protein
MEFGEKEAQTFIAKVSTDERWEELTSNKIKIDPENSKKLVDNMHNCVSYFLIVKNGVFLRNASPMKC